MLGEGEGGVRGSTLHSPVVVGKVVGEAVGQEVAEADGGEDDAEEGDGGGLGFEGPRVGKAHGFAEEVDDALVSEGRGVGEEEEAQGEVEEADRGDDCFGGYERHGGGCGGLFAGGLVEGSWGCERFSGSGGCRRRFVVGGRARSWARINACGAWSSRDGFSSRR